MKRRATILKNMNFVSELQKYVQKGHPQRQGIIPTKLNIKNWENKDVKKKQVWKCGSV